jgi:hypothetical protein
MERPQEDPSLSCSYSVRGSGRLVRFESMSSMHLDGFTSRGASCSSDLFMFGAEGEKACRFAGPMNKTMKLDLSRVLF